MATLTLSSLFRASINCVSCRDGIIEDTIEEERSDPRSYIIGEPTSASRIGLHGAATTEQQAGHVNVTSDSHSTKSDSS